MLQASLNAGFNRVSFSFIAMPRRHLWWVNRLIKKKEKIRVSWTWNLAGTITNTMKLNETSVESRESFICDPVRRRRSWLHHPPPSARSALLPSIPSPFMRPLPPYADVSLLAAAVQCLPCLPTRPANHQILIFVFAPAKVRMDLIEVSHCWLLSLYYFWHLHSPSRRLYAFCVGLRFVMVLPAPV